MAQIQSAGGVLRRLPELTLFAVYRASDGVSATKRSTQRKMRMAPVEVTCREPPCITLTHVNAHVHTYMILPHINPLLFSFQYIHMYISFAIIITLALSARQCLDRIRFKRIYGEGQKPVLISGLMDQWKARQLWRE